MIDDVNSGVDAAGIVDLTKWPTRIVAEINRAVDEWDEGAKVGRLWAGDAALWTGTDEAQWLGWLRILDEQRGSDELETVSAVALGGAFDDGWFWVWAGVESLSRGAGPELWSPA